MTTLSITSHQPYVLADHIALDMINTIAKINGQAYDFWQSANDVIYWLTTVANIQLPLKKEFSDEALFNTALVLRETIRVLIQQKKAGEPLQIESLNTFLFNSSSWLSLEIDDKGESQLIKHYKQDTPMQVLTPLAEAAAELLTQGNFDLVKVCEHNDCVLWFYDKTKTHKRRWCSMAICGNRNKVAKFRKKQ